MKEEIGEGAREGERGETTREKKEKLVTNKILNLWRSNFTLKNLITKVGRYNNFI